jgi:hypothetical protein
MINLTSSQLRQAADLKDKIEALETELAGLIEGKAPGPIEAAIEAEEPAKPGKRTMSPAHKAALRAAQALRWAKHNAAKGQSAAKPAKKARIAAAQKLRWAKVKAAKTVKAPAKSEAKPAKRKMSAAAKAAISAAAKARWAKVRAGKK